MPFAIIISAPSGAGKTTLTHRLLACRADVGYSVSATTRAPRAGEQDGVSYHFLGIAEFEAAVARGEFAEYARVHGNMYGTLRREVRRVLESGRHVVMDIDVQGAAQFAAAFPDAVRIFVLPPSGEALIARLRGRKTEDDATIATRLRDAISELDAVHEFDYVVVNDDIDRAVGQLCCIIDAETLRRVRAPAAAEVAREIVATVASALEALPTEVS
jgi:guanylate kinase